MIRDMIRNGIPEPDILESIKDITEFLEVSTDAYNRIYREIRESYVPNIDEIDRRFAQLEKSIREIKVEIPSEGYVNRKQAAKLLGPEVSWLENNDKKEGIQPYKFGGNVVYNVSELLKWANNRKVLS